MRTENKWNKKNALWMLLYVVLYVVMSFIKLVLRFLPKDIYEAGKDHPAPSKKKQLIGHLLTAAFCGYFVWSMKDNADRIKREQLGFTEAFKRLAVFMYIIKAFDIVAHDRGWNNKKQGTRLLLYPVICAAPAYFLTKKGEKAE